MMQDYMRVLHARFCRETELQGVREACRTLKEKLGQQGQKILLQLADLENKLRKESLLMSFIAGFQLSTGIAEELEPYSFEDEEERRAAERANMRYPYVKD